MRSVESRLALTIALVISAGGVKASFAQTSNVSTSTLRAVVDTTLGAFTVELDRAAAPETVRRFLARSYDGLQLCEARAHGYLVFGCAPFRLDGPKGDAPHRESPLLEEIDGIAMGLDRQPIDVPQPIEWLWQQEVFPLYLQLRDKGRPIPAGLETLIEAARTKGTAAIEQLKGKSRLWYLTQLGHRFTAGRSAARFSRGAVGVAAFWPGAGDERFVIALTDLPERDGRATVFGRIVDGWDTLDRIEMLPVDKSHRTLTAVFLNAVRIEGSAPGEGSGSNKDPTR